MNANRINSLEDAVKVKNWLRAMSDASEHEWLVVNNDQRFRNKLIENSHTLVEYARRESHVVALKTIQDILNLIDYSKISYINRESQPVLNDIAVILETVFIKFPALIKFPAVRSVELTSS